MDNHPPQTGSPRGTNFLEGRSRSLLKYTRKELADAQRLAAFEMFKPESRTTTTEKG